MKNASLGKPDPNMRTQPRPIADDIRNLPDHRMFRRDFDGVECQQVIAKFMAERQERDDFSE